MGISISRGSTITPTGAVSRSYTEINGIPAIRLSFSYFDTIWACTAESTYVALFDGQTRLFELDAQACEDNVDATQAIFEAMQMSFKP